TLINIRPYTKDGIVRITTSNVRVIKERTGPTILCDIKNATGIASTDPNIVPKNAIHIVSNNKYGTPSSENSNRNSKSGDRIPVIIFPAMVEPRLSIQLNCTPVTDHIRNASKIANIVM